MWLNVAGVQAFVVWHVSHDWVVGIWFVPLPVAIVPLWQEAQVPLTCVWSTLVAGFHAATAWHDSQRLLLVMCVAFLPVACVPLWQLAQFVVMPV